MNKTITNLLVLSTFFIALFISCENDSTDFTVGENWVNSSTKVYFIDTLTVKSSTFKFDSLSVTNTNRLLIGAYTDESFGLVKSKSYIQFQNSDFSIDNSAVYDSVALILKFDGYTYNDTLPKQEFKIYELLDDISTDDDYFYNTTTIEANNEAIGLLNFNPKPVKKDSVSIKLNNTFGEPLFSKILENEINNSDDFLDEYKGILIEPTETNTTVLGISKDSYLRLYYTVDDETEDGSQTLDFTFSSINSFHNIISDKQNTNLAEIEQSQTSILSTEAENQSYIQSGIGIATKIDIPNIEQLYNIQGTGTVINANLKLTLKQNSNNVLKTRDSLQVYIIDHKYNIVGNLYNYDEGSDATAIGVIVDKDNEFNITNYSIPIKYFIDLKQTELNAENLFLAIYSKDYNESVDRYILNGEKASNELKLKVELIYAVYDE